MSKLDKMLKEYVRVFKQNFPIFLIPSAPESEIILVIEKCLKEGLPYKPDNDKNVIH